VDVPAITHNEYGDGEAVYVGTSLFEQYYESGYHGHKRLLENALYDVRDERAYLVEAPTSIEVNAMRTDDAVYLHIVNYHAGRPEGDIPQITDVIPVSDVTVNVHEDVREATTDVRVDVKRRDDGIRLELDSVEIHEIVELY
jgi:hypothetical protein